LGEESTFTGHSKITHHHISSLHQADLNYS